MRKSLKIWAFCAAVAALVVSLAPPASAAPADLDTYYSKFDVGQQAIPGADSTTWVPQGLSKWSEETLIISYYDVSSSPQASRIFLVNRTTGDTVKWFKLSTTCHVGGLATTSSYMWVACGGELQRYARGLLSSQASGTTLGSNGSYPVAASSYAFGQGETVWVGRFKEGWKSGDPCPSASDRGRMYQYNVSSGVPNYIPGRYFDTPSSVQGVAISNDRFVWSTSCGRNNRSKLIIGPGLRSYDGSSSYRTITAPNMSEGMVIANNQLQIVYETASGVYADASYRIRSVHHSQVSFGSI